MASRTQNVRQGVLFAVEDELIEEKQLGKRMHSDCDETMKKVKLSECKETTPKILRSSTEEAEETLPKTVKAVCSKKKTRHRVQRNVDIKKQRPSFWSCDMANKENEVLCSGTVPKVCNDNRNSQLNSGEFPASQTDGTSVTYADYFAQISKDHATMTQVLFGRNLRLSVALTFWQKSASELVAYLVRIRDTAVVADCLPVLTKSLEEEKESISIGCCVDLLPLVQELLRSRFEEYLIVGLNWLWAVLKRWWPELSANAKNSDATNVEDQNIVIMKDQLRQLREQGYHLSSFPGYTGKVAKSVGTYLEQLY
ncbi:KATNB1-like protein 1 [Hemitrygon akajei]|uniref:KATNB1-like protein 1 n=1 Tax=Hypanus sabinus TaxID=79690 RepID=UPI0028C4EE10|nr:KATNB1-like protein 1 [Hypanus sabinus]